MSKFTVQQPVIHLPSFKEYKVTLAYLRRKYLELGVEIPFPPSDNNYYHTDVDGFLSIASHLLFKSSLYKQDKFDCEDYALKAQTLCAELYGLNALRYTYGTMPLGAHGFGSHWCGDNFLLLEPNSAFSKDPVFEIGMNGYQPKAVLL